jgi:glycosyltransferase involved in cell wall biosynthesis
VKVALVCSWLNQYGGAERVLEVLHDMYPNAPIYTSMYEPKAMPAFYRSWDIRTSFMQRLPLVKQKHQAFVSLYPYAFEQFDLTEYDVVISNSSAFAHGVITRPETCHVCYCLTPARFIWNYHEYVKREHLSRIVRTVVPMALTSLRTWDAQAADRVDYFVAISRAVADRINKYYRRDSEIIYPPVDTTMYTPSEEVEDYFLIVSRLIPYKRIDLAVRAFNELGLPLKIVGGGRDAEALQRIAKPNVQFLGRVPDDEVKRLYARCRAFIFPGEEDFGLTPLEAQAAGRPAIAYAGGGALDTIIEGETGAFFREPTAKSLAETVRNFDHTKFDSVRIRQHALKFDTEVFKKQLAEFVERSAAEHRQRLTESYAQKIGPASLKLREI